MRVCPTFLRLVPAIWMAGVVFGGSDPGADQVRELAQLDLKQLSEIQIVSAARHEQNRADSPRSVSLITGEEIRRRNFRNVPEAVAGVAGVYLQQTNYGGGSPIIRGMVGNRILVMINGIRLNSGTYRLGPNQYLNQIDINQVERIEVVRGAGSVLYGSDAFGGVINVITTPAPDPRLGSGSSAESRVRFATADSSGAGRIQVATSQGHLGLLAGYTQEQFGDLTAGSPTGLQRHTGYGQSAGDLSFKFSAGADKTLVGGLSRMKQFDVPRSDTLLAGTDLQYSWNPEGRDLAYVRYEQGNPIKYVGAMEVTLAWQRPFEFLERIAPAEPFVQSRHADVVNSANFGVQFSSAPAASHALTYGFEAASNRIGSTRTDLDLRTGVRAAMPGFYADESRFSNLAVFVQDEIAVSDRLAALVGARYDRSRAQATLYSQSTGIVYVDARPGAITGSGHVLYELTSHLSATAGVSQGFRAPNIDDTTILGGTGQRFDVPNANLKPERSVNFEYGLRVRGRFGSASIVAFEDRYRDFIDRAPATWNGLPYVDLNGNGKRDSSDPAVYQRQNISRTSVNGLELDAVVKLSNSWTWSHMTTWTRGTDTSASQPLTRIPPLNGASRITWNSSFPVWVEGALVAATAQRRLAPADKTDIRIGPLGTPGYAVFHLRAGLHRTFLAGLTVAWENITNRRYRLHGSGIDRPGSNLVLGYTRAF
jgi:iron complex outermembrane receptor protein/hemoglobin/transferrin/lactoferrin receptor protein